MTVRLTSLRLGAFKSVRNAELHLGPLTLIAGRNGSGKSNIIDALAVLSALATGASLRDALDGGRFGPTVRGGSEGCAPLGSDRFAIGCSAEWGGEPLYLDVTVRTAPVLQIESEHLWTLRAAGARRGEPLSYLKSDPADPTSGDIAARWENQKRGVNPPVSMRADQLLTTQVATRVPATSQAGRTVHEAAEAMLSAIDSVFILDPVPHQMREYVPQKDAVLRRSADNLSAVLSRLTRDADRRDLLLGMTRSLSEAQVSDLAQVSSDLGDVMVTITEKIGGEQRKVPARLMSDGTLRFLAIAAAFLDDAPGQASLSAPRLLVVEEIENGLHPSQAALLVERLKAAAEDRGVRTVATTHSPAILDALSGPDHQHVAITARDNDGWSRITRLVDFPDYFEVVSRNSLGASAVRDDMRPGRIDAQGAERTLAEIF